MVGQGGGGCDGVVVDCVVVNDADVAVAGAAVCIGPCRNPALQS